MKINKKKVIYYVVYYAVICGVLFLLIGGGTLMSIVTGNIVICVVIAPAVDMIFLGLMFRLLYLIDIAFSDEFKEEIIDYLETAHQTQNTATVSNHGNNLKEVMEAIRHEDWEYNAFFDLSGRKLAEGTYQSPKSCNITSEDWKEIDQRREDVISLHNHPGTSDGAFSCMDFAAFLQRDYIRQSIVVTRKYNYVLIKNGNDYEQYTQKAKKYAAEISTRYLWLGYLSHRRWTVLTSKKTAKKFGLEFCIERVPQPTTQKNIFRIGLATCVIMALCLVGHRFLLESSPLLPTTVASSTKTSDSALAPIGGGVNCDD